MQSDDTHGFAMPSARNAQRTVQAAWRQIDWASHAGRQSQITFEPAKGPRLMVALRRGSVSTCADLSRIECASVPAKKTELNRNPQHESNHGTFYLFRFFRFQRRILVAKPFSRR